jgi:hypothetical protein
MMFHFRNHVMIHLFDVLLSAVLMIVAAPLMLVVMIMIYAHGGGLAHFRETRVGCNERIFTHRLHSGSAGLAQVTNPADGGMEGALLRDDLDQVPLSAVLFLCTAQQSIEDSINEQLLNWFEWCH